MLASYTLLLYLLPSRAWTPLHSSPHFIILPSSLSKVSNLFFHGGGQTEDLTRIWEKVSRKLLELCVPLAYTRTLQSIIRTTKCTVCVRRAGVIAVLH